MESIINDMLGFYDAISIVFFTKNIEKTGKICYNVYLIDKNVARRNNDGGSQCC
ncbi:Uncharacterised protein [Campylobacter geochelonis]|uniref:Uncharacterized protein n=1 Tax=Campylobacter geochelonis TaxID=1780362 RepID=A0A128EJV6_9BACT|nr:hypothetical protein CGEO_1337 [Campylobacter geochelonis]CZE48682.1 Uncharacterised protein [Campylobacter geochelonis]